MGGLFVSCVPTSGFENSVGNQGNSNWEKCVSNIALVKTQFSML